MNSSTKKWDVFISHASEDKEVVAIPLTEALKARGVDVWLDRNELRLGDSLRKKIDEGLANSLFGVVVLSPSFFSKKWTQNELGALLSSEDNVQIRVLPVWYQVERGDVEKFSPILCDRLAVRWSDGLGEIVSQISEVVESKRTTSPGEHTNGESPFRHDRAKGTTVASDARVIARIELLERLFQNETFQHSEKLRLDRAILTNIVHTYFKAVESYKQYHTIERVQESKQASLISYWIARLRPIQIVDASDSERDLMANESFALWCGMAFARVSQETLSDYDFQRVLYRLPYELVTEGELFEWFVSRTKK